MAIRFGGKLMAAGANRALLGASTTQIRGYCQQASSSPVLPARRGRAKYFVGGVVSALTFWHLVVGIKLNEIKEMEHARRLIWEAQKK